MLTKVCYLDTLPQKDFRKNKEKILKHEIGENGSGFLGGDNQRVSKVKFSTRLKLPQTNKNHKTGNYFSTLELCKALGINHKTYRRHEGKLFPQAQRDPNTGFRIFTEKQITHLKALWNKKTEYLHKKRHYHYHKTGNYYSLPEACKAIGISTVTFRKHEGNLLPLILRDKAGRRLFIGSDIEQIKEVWENHKKRK